MRALALAALASLLASGFASAAPCKDVRGQFVRCPAPAAAKSAARCKAANGKFAKCGTRGARPL